MDKKLLDSMWHAEFDFIRSVQLANFMLLTAGNILDRSLVCGGWRTLANSSSTAIILAFKAGTQFVLGIICFGEWGGRLCLGYSFFEYPPLLRSKIMSRVKAKMYSLLLIFCFVWISHLGEKKHLRLQRMCLFLFFAFCSFQCFLFCFVFGIL